MLKVFLSWSGSRSKILAASLRDWLPEVMQFCQPWMSDTDIPKGTQWLQSLGKELSESDAGIVCVTKENQLEPWLLFEAGALARHFRMSGRVCVYLFGIRPVDLTAGPLTLYQAAEANKSDTWGVIASLNEIHTSFQVDEKPLRRAFDRSWPEFEAKTCAIPDDESTSAPALRSDREILEELLSGVRGLQRAITQSYARVESYVAPRTSIERTIMQIWQRLLGLERVGVRDDFFALGGSSLLALQLAVEICRELRIDFSAVDILENPTVESQARLLASRETSD